ncbi:MAG: hypothetical protein GXO30_04860 [Epsilonproteobacteria bacterium]|nr:hypothetical protein [Campylobacterota bacterium]
MKRKLSQNDIEIFYAMCYLIRNNKPLTKVNIARKAKLTWRTVHNRINYHREFKEL